MAAVLRAYGVAFEADAFLAGCTLPVCAVHRRGETIRRREGGEAVTFGRSGVHLSIGQAEIGQLDRQIAEAVAFLRDEAEQVRRLRDWPGVEDLTLDLAGVQLAVPAQFVTLPPELVRRCGELGLAIEVSLYAVDEG